MSKIAVVTDTNSGITREEAKKLGVYLLPMPFIVDGTEYFEGVTCTYEHFFEMLEAGAEVSTSQPSPESLTAMARRRFHGRRPHRRGRGRPAVHHQRSAAAPRP